MRKFLITLLLISVFAIAELAPAKATAAAGDSFLDEALLNKGVIGVQHQSSNKLKVMIEAQGKRYTYDLNSEGKEEFFPLQLGNASYTVTLLENTTGNKYKVLNKDTVSLALQNSNIVFLNSTQNVNWDTGMTAIKKAKELTSKAKTDEEKVTAIYQYITKNVQYDYNLANNVQAGYIPTIDKVYSSQKGICFDYSALFASMLRSVGVPTKLVMGNSTYVNVYHAWNEVYLNNKWVVVDTTVDAGLLKSKKTAAMIKSAADYKTDLVY